MKRVVRGAVVAGVTTLVAGLVAAAPAGAATPTQVVHEQLNLSLPNIEECGFTVNSLVQGTHTFQTFVDRSGNVRFQDTAHVVSTLTNVANGKVVYVESAGRDAYGDPGVVNPDGTITFTDTLTGRAQRVYTSHSSVLLKDVGYLAILDTFDAQGNFLDEQLIVHGPHQFAGDFSAYCDAITAAIG